MKKVFLYISSIFLLTGMVSCGEDFLKIDHYDILQPDVLFRNEATIIQGLNGVYDLFYPEKASGTTDIQSSWNIKPQLAFSNYPALDCQASGWDNEFSRHEWRADKDMFNDGWKQCYKAVDRANRFLNNLSTVNATAVFANGETTKNIIEAEARAIRAFFYSYLAQNFGRIPMLMPGETYINTPAKPRPDTMEETWKLIIEDFEFAAKTLEWKPWNGQYGRITRGMAKAYLAQAYMYNKRFEDAKKELKEIIDSGIYQLKPCFGQIHMENVHWDSESVWEVFFPQFPEMGWGAAGQHDAVMWSTYLTASPEYDGWGSLYISYEFCNSFENGDKRRQYSVVERGNTHPFTGEKIGVKTDFTEEFVGSELMPNNYSIKYWKRKPGSDNMVMNPTSYRWMRYAGVLLNYAECCFETNDPASGWQAIRDVRNRAWGNLEVGLQQGDFPIPLNTATVTVPDAETFYTSYKSTKGYKADVWKVAITMERRHEFMAEFSFWYDLCRTNMAEEFINCEYPKGQGYQKRAFDFNPNRMLYPIPTDEIMKNAAIGPEDQNPGY